jgi:hypothetical protein
LNQNDFIAWLVQAMLSWSRWLADMVWSALRTGSQGGFLSWFVNHWMSLAASLIVAGVVADWLVWMVRWRPYWRWFNKRQIIYADTSERKPGAERKPSAERPQRRVLNEYYDPFARPEGKPRTYAMSDYASGEEHDEAGRNSNSQTDDGDDFWEFDEELTDGEDIWEDELPDAGDGWEEEDDSWIDLAVPELTKKPPRGRDQ